MAQYIVMEGLPAPIERALRRAVFEYSIARRKFLDQFAGQYDEEFSVTDLSQAPKQLWLKRKFRKDIIIDLVRDNYFSLLGSVVHHILEHHAPPHCIVEERQHVIITIGGIRVLFHGQPDLYDPTIRHLDDYKFTSATAILYEKPEYEFQLNANKWLFESRGLRVDTIRNVYLFRYLDPRLQQANPEYPKDNIYLKDFKPWTRAKTEETIKGLIANLLKYRNTDWSKLPDCTDEERWIRDSSYAILKRKVGTKKEPIQDWGKNAWAKCDTKEEAVQLLSTNPPNEETKIVERKGSPRKCMDYCPVVRWCGQRQKELGLAVEVKRNKRLHD